MGGSKKVATKKRVEVGEVVTFLGHIMDGLRAGSVLLECGDEALILRPSAELKFCVEAKQKKGKGKIVMEISWENDFQHNDDDLTIRVGEGDPPGDVNT